ncbi:MAG: DUF4249 family protein [Bacteroidetes bacterium]|jgi:hypothetical protein|nr:DUF4249 family protein [Bacteroidota bacterium]
MHIALRGALAVIAFMSVACETAFDPEGTFEDRIVLFGLLTPGSDSVQLRLQATYDPPTPDPLSYAGGPDLTGATGRLFWERGAQANLRDTVVPHPDSGRYPTGLHLLTAPVRVVRGVEYTVRVEVPGFAPVEAMATVPGSAPIYFLNEDLLRQPFGHPADRLGIIVGLAPEAEGFIPRVEVEYEVISQGNRIERREVPSSMSVTVSGTVPVYPKIRGASSRRSSGSSTIELYEYEAKAYRFLVQELHETYGSPNLRFRRAILTVRTFDRHLYTYYFLVNGFFDQYTVRTDRPDYSNVRGGVGVVGAFAVDSVVVALPPVL